MGRIQAQPSALALCSRPNRSLVEHQRARQEPQERGREPFWPRPQGKPPPCRNVLPASPQQPPSFLPFLEPFPPHLSSGTEQEENTTSGTFGQQSSLNSGGCSEDALRENKKAVLRQCSHPLFCRKMTVLKRLGLPNNKAGRRRSGFCKLSFVLPAFRVC